MNISNMNFSLADFLAYFIPGCLIISALLAILPIFHLSLDLNEYPSILTIPVAVFLAYYLGVLASGVTLQYEKIARRNIERNQIADPRVVIPDQLACISDEINNAFRDIFDLHKECGAAQFYLTRTLVRHFLPETYIVADRQNSLRQLRRNSRISLLVWGATGILWGIRLCTATYLIEGLTLIFVTAIASFILTFNVLGNGMRSNREREWRELCTGLFILHKNLHNMKSND